MFEINTYISVDITVIIDNGIDCLNNNVVLVGKEFNNACVQCSIDFLQWRVN